MHYLEDLRSLTGWWGNDTVSLSIFAKARAISALRSVPPMIISIRRVASVVLRQGRPKFELIMSDGRLLTQPGGIN
jgi:hypothetical protein